MTTKLETWLAQTAEEAIEPDLPICDPHHHMWDRPDNRYMLDNLLADTESGHNIVSTVFIECSSEYRTYGPRGTRPLGETEFVESVAVQHTNSGNKTAVHAGIVGFADMMLGAEVSSVLEAHIAISPDRFRGIRHASAWDADQSFVSYKSPVEGLLYDSKFREGYAKLEEYGLSFDAWLYHPQLGDLLDLAKSFPATTIVLDHIGGPLGKGPYAGRKEEIFENWKKGIASLADIPNVVVKLGGLGMPNYGNEWHERDVPPGSVELAETMKPFFDHCIEKLGADRCMFESNFPVDKVSYSYNVMWNAFKRVSEGYSETERASLFHDTATRVYRIG